MKSKSTVDPRRLRGLPKAERDLLLKQAAANVGPEYAEDGSLGGFEAFGEQDDYDASIVDD